MVESRTPGTSGSFTLLYTIHAMLLSRLTPPLCNGLPKTGLRMGIGTISKIIQV